MSDCLKQVDRISGKAGDGLGKDDVYFSGFAVIKHSLEFFTLGGLGSGNTIICINTNVLPFWV